MYLYMLCIESISQHSLCNVKLNTVRGVRKLGDWFKVQNVVEINGFLIL